MGRRLLVRAATSAAFAGAGVLGITAAAQRWYPHCRLGAFDSNATCISVQDHRYDYLVPAESWEPVGSAAQLAGVGLALLAAAVVLFPVALGTRPRAWVTVLAGGAAAGTAVVGWMCAVSGYRGEVYDVPGLWVAGVLWLIGVPVSVTASVVSAEIAAEDVDLRTGVWRWAVACMVGLVANPVVGSLFLAPVVLWYSSYDTVPWTEAVTSAPLLLAALAIWPASTERPAPGRAADTDPRAAHAPSG